MGFPATTIAGETVEIVSKEDNGDRQVLVTAEDQRYVMSDANDGTIEPYNPEKHIGGSATQAVESIVNPLTNVDATEFANAKAEAEAAAPFDATEAAEAKAAFDKDPLSGGDEIVVEEGVTTDLAEEQPSGGVVKDGPPPSTGGADVPLPVPVPSTQEPPTSP